MTEDDSLSASDIARRESMKERYENHTKTVSQLMRYIGFGLLAAFYTTRSQLGDLAMGDVLSLVHIAVGLCGMLAILSDYFQHMCAASTYRRAASDSKNAYQYNKKALSVRLTVFFYYSKQVAIAVGSISLATLILIL